MTTIAANLKEMAADTRLTWDDESTSPGIKIERVHSEIIGIAGDVAAGNRYLDWYRAGSKGRKPKVTKDFKALRLNKEGLYLVDHDLVWVKVDAPFYAIGSGAQLAIGALEMGATPKQAVEIAAKHDNYTGGQITTLELI